MGDSLETTLQSIEDMIDIFKEWGNLPRKILYQMAIFYNIRKRTFIFASNPGEYTSPPFLSLAGDGTITVARWSLQGAPLSQIAAKLHGDVRRIANNLYNNDEISDDLRDEIIHSLDWC